MTLQPPHSSKRTRSRRYKYPLNHLGECSQFSLTYTYYSLTTLIFIPKQEQTTLFLEFNPHFHIHYIFPLQRYWLNHLKIPNPLKKECFVCFRTLTLSYHIPLLWKIDLTAWTLNKIIIQSPKKLYF